MSSAEHGDVSGLSGIRVVDFGHQIAGPLAALLLADAGADVVCVDSPAAAGALGPLDAYLNRGKQRITLDLKHEGDRRTARELVAHADIVIENFRPGVMDRLGLGADVVQGTNERLIYCSMPGFAADDERADLPAWEGVLHAAVAGYRPLSQHWDPTGRNNATVTDPDAPLFTPITTASNFGGLMGAVSIVMALIARERSGRGQRIQLPLAEAFAEAYSTMLGFRVYENGLMGDNQMLSDLTYRCSDGGLIDLSPYAKFVIPLLAQVGVAEEWQAQGLIDIGERSFSLAKRDQIMAMFADLVRTQPAAWWDDLATKSEMPVSMVRTPRQWMATNQAAAAGVVVTLDDPIAGRVTLPGRSFELSQPLPPLGPRHLPDQDREQVLSALKTPLSPRASAPGWSPTDAVDLPLHGFTAVDISQAVAGPTAARLLADFGADVIKIGSTVPGVTDGIVGQLHRGKRTILLNGRSSDGVRLTGDLIRDADIVVTNFTPKSLVRYGIDYARVHAMNPDLVYCSITAYGQTGPWANRRGYENQCNAATGMSSRYGSRFGWTLYQPTPINDADTGVLGAFAVAVALYSRQRGGSGQKVAASLVQGSTLHQAVHLASEALSSDDGPDAARSEYGLTALYRLYQAKDGWFFLSAMESDLPALWRPTGLDQSEELTSWRDPSGALARRLAAHFLGESCEHWTAQLLAAGIAAQQVVSIDDAIDYLQGRGVVYLEPGIDGKDVARPGIGQWLSDTPPRVGANPGAVGSQAREILAGLGLSAAEMTALSEADVLCLPEQLPTLTRLT